MNIYKRHRFPSEIISYAVWLCQRFNLSHRDIEDLLAERGICVSCESIRLWCIKFGPKYARRLKRRHGGFGDTYFIDEVFVKINGRHRYLWRAVDQDGMWLMCASNESGMVRQPGVFSNECFEAVSHEKS